jgi:hypothetical protein
MAAPKPAKPTIHSMNSYCKGYQDPFPEVRGFETFKNLH